MRAGQNQIHRFSIILVKLTRQDGSPRTVGATPDGTYRTRWRSSELPLEVAALCPFPFPYQIWFDGDAVRTRTAKGLFRRGR